MMKKMTYNDLIFRIHEKMPKFGDTGELEPCAGIIGQERAVNAIKMGLDMRQEGYNIFISGMTGTGRSTTIKKLLDNMAQRKKAVLEDKVFVNNFMKPEHPIFISLKAGDGIKLKKYMHSLVKYFMRIIPAIVEEPSFKSQRGQEIDKYNNERQKIIDEFKKRAADVNFTVEEVQEENKIKAVLMPLIEKKPVPMEQLEGLEAKGELKNGDLGKIRIIMKRLTSDLQDVYKSIAEMEERLDAKIQTILYSNVEAKVDSRIRDIEKLMDNKKVTDYLESVAEFIKSHPHFFFIDQQELKQRDYPAKSARNLQGRFSVFDVNVIVSNGGITSPPVLIENSPNFRNLFGIIERPSANNGDESSAFMNIRPGSLVLADGGYLVMDAGDVMQEAGVYNELKRILRTREHTIQHLEHFYGQNVSALKPESIPLNVKIILIGSEYLYDNLNYIDEDFIKIFKVKAQFDSEFENSLNNQKEYGSFLSMLCAKEKLRPLSFAGFEQVLRYSSRLAGNGQKLSTQFTSIADLIREADYFAQQGRRKVIDEKHIKKALKNKEHMYSLIQEKMLEWINKDAILINTTDVAVGQINALVVHTDGEVSFGMPARVTVSTSIGEQGIVNIEREAELSGSYFDKAILIIDGYLRKIFAQYKPLSVNVSLAFEQSYGGIEGDSASQAEIIAILSSLSEISIKQYLGITGSVNQLGEIQPIGGVNEKIEGFYNVCKMRGLEKGQGVIIPARNINEMVLNDDVLDAVKKGLFTIWAVDRVEESVEIMMGVPAGKIEKDGGFTPGSVYAIADKKLWEYANTWKKWSNID